jgi:hypothetical protein
VISQRRTPLVLSGFLEVVFEQAAAGFVPVDLLGTALWVANSERSCEILNDRYTKYVNPQVYQSPGKTENAESLSGD